MAARDRPRRRPPRRRPRSSATRHGLVMAAAGVDASNTEPGTVVLLPRGPRRLGTAAARAGSASSTGRNVAVVVTDTAAAPGATARPTSPSAPPGSSSSTTTPGAPTATATSWRSPHRRVADEVAAAADLAKGKLGGRPSPWSAGWPRSSCRPATTGPARRALVRDEAQRHVRPRRPRGGARRGRRHAGHHRASAHRPPWTPSSRRCGSSSTTSPRSEPVDDGVEVVYGTGARCPGRRSPRRPARGGAAGARLGHADGPGRRLGATRHSVDSAYPPARRERDVAKTKKDADRRAVVEQMRREQKRKERRKSLVILGAAVTVGALIIGYAAWAAVKETEKRRPRPGLARCPGVGGGVPGRRHQEGRGEQRPPARGQEDRLPDVSPGSRAALGAATSPGTQIRKFWTTDDRPPSSGSCTAWSTATRILWYDETIADDDKALDELRSIAGKFPSTTDFNDKFMRRPWTSEDGDPFPGGTHVALTHWSMGGTPANPDGQLGVWQYCSDVSGEVVEQFMQDYPYSDSPEPRRGLSGGRGRWPSLRGLVRLGAHPADQPRGLPRRARRARRAPSSVWLLAVGRRRRPDARQAGLVLPRRERAPVGVGPAQGRDPQGAGEARAVAQPHPRAAGLRRGLVFASAASGFPPFAIVAVLAGQLRMNVALFLVVGTVGTHAAVRGVPRRRGVAHVAVLRAVLSRPAGCPARAAPPPAPGHRRPRSRRRARHARPRRHPARGRSRRPASRPTTAPAMRTEPRTRAPSSTRAPATTSEPSATVPATTAPGSTRTPPLPGATAGVGATPMTTSREAATSAWGDPTSRQ